MEPKPTKISLIFVGLLVVTAIVMATAIILEQTDLDNTSDASILTNNPIVNSIKEKKVDNTEVPSLYPCSNNNYCKAWESCVDGYCQ